MVWYQQKPLLYDCGCLLLSLSLIFSLFAFSSLFHFDILNWRSLSRVDERLFSSGWPSHWALVTANQISWCAWSNRLVRVLVLSSSFDIITYHWHKLLELTLLFIEKTLKWKSHGLKKIEVKGFNAEAFSCWTIAACQRHTLFHRLRTTFTERGGKHDDMTRKRNADLQPWSCREMLLSCHFCLASQTNIDCLKASAC